MCSNHPYQDCTSWMFATFGTKQPSSGNLFLFQTYMTCSIYRVIYIDPMFIEIKNVNGNHIFLDVSLDGKDQQRHSFTTHRRRTCGAILII